MSEWKAGLTLEPYQELTDRARDCSLADLVQTMRHWAKRDYDKHGLDFVVECFSDEDIAEAIKGAKTVRGAKRKLLSVVRPQAERRSEIESSESW